MKQYAANIITGWRIVFAALMLAFPVFSSWFYATYLAGGVTDMIDGTVARKTNSVSAFGSRLDSVADFVFVASALVRILPAIHVPRWLLAWIFVIAVIKAANIVSGFIRNRRFIAEHTVLNKLTGFSLFLLPLMFPFADIRYGTAAVCAMATAAAIQEGYYIEKGIEV